MSLDLKGVSNLINKANIKSDDQAIYLRKDDTLSQTSGLGRLAKLFTSKRQEENRASVNRLWEAVKKSPAYEKLVKDPSITSFFTKKLESGTPLTVKDVQTIARGLAVLGRAGKAREMVEKHVLPKGSAKDFAVFLTKNRLSLNNDKQENAAVRAFFKEKKVLEGSVRAACRNAGIEQKLLDKAVSLITNTTEYQEGWNKALEYKEKSSELRINHLRKGGTGLDYDRLHAKTSETALAPKALALASALLNDKNFLALLNTDEASARGVFRDLAALADADKINLESGQKSHKPVKRLAFLKNQLMNPDAGKMNPGAVKRFTVLQDPAMNLESKMNPDQAKDFLAFCAKQSLSLGSTAERDQALGAWMLEPKAAAWGEEAAGELGLKPEVGRAVAHLSELKGRIMAKMATLPAGDLAVLEKTAKAVMSEFLTEKSKAIDSFLGLVNQPLKEVQGIILSASLTEGRLQALLGPFLAGEVLLDHLLAPPEKQKGLSPELIDAVRDFTLALKDSRNDHYPRGGEDRRTDLQDDALLLLMNQRGITPEQLDSAGRTYLQPLHQNFQTLENMLGDGRVGGQGADSLKENLADMRAVLLDTGALSSALMNYQTRWTEGALPEPHQSVRDLAARFGVKMPNVGYGGHNDPLIKAETAAWFGPDNAPAAATQRLTDEVGRLAKELGLVGDRAVDPRKLNLDSLAALARGAMQSAGRGSRAPLSPEQARAAVLQAVREQLTALKAAFDQVDKLPVVEKAVADNVKAGITQAEKTWLFQAVAYYELRKPELINATVAAARGLAKGLDELPASGLTRTSLAGPILTMARESLAVTRSIQTDKQGELERPRVMPAALMMALGASPLDTRTLLYNALVSPEGQSLAGDFRTLRGEFIKQDGGAIFEAVMANAMRVMIFASQSLARELGRSVTIGQTPPRSPLHEIPGQVCQKALGLNHTQLLPGLTALGSLRAPLNQAQREKLMPLMEMVSKSFDPSGLKDKGRLQGLDRLHHFVAGHAKEMLAAMEAKGGAVLAPRELWGVIFGKTEKAPRDLSADNVGARIYETAVKRLTRLAQAADPAAGKEQCAQSLKLGLPLAKLEGLFKPGGTLNLADIRNGLYLDPGPLRDGVHNDFGLSRTFHNREWHSEKSQTGPAAISLVGKGAMETVDNKDITKANCQGSDKHRAIIAKAREITSGEPQFLRLMQCFSQAGPLVSTISRQLPSQYALSENAYCNMEARLNPDGSVSVTVANPKGDAEHPVHFQAVFTIPTDGETRLTDLQIHRPPR